jgi:hypothetical protein
VSKRFSFKSDVKYDIALLTEVESLNPFAYKVAKKIWNDIATNLMESEMNMSVTERRCKDRTMLLLKGFKKDEGISQRG